MQLGQQFRDQVRSLLKIRTARTVTPMGQMPRVGSTIFRGEVRITVQAGLSEDLWLWLAMQGWREPTVPADRRRYRDMPASLVARLFDAPAEERMRILATGVSRATCKPVTGGAPRTIPSSIARR